jgi:serine/threonine protein kinase
VLQTEFTPMSERDGDKVQCAECGATLQGETSKLGCLNCLLLGGPNEPVAENRRLQDFEICCREDGVTLDELGRGAMGITYRARDLTLGSLVALKVISARYSGDLGSRERFRREARAAAQLRHPNVAAVFHFGETDTGRCFYAMELIEGETVEAYVRRNRLVPPYLALEVALQVARALIAAEAHGLVHRDLKPSNLMIVRNESGDPDALVVKVIDFGLAKSVAMTLAEDTRVAFSGTPDFASPEQLRAERAVLDTRSDIFSLGATLWYLLCGQPPFRDSSVGKARDEMLPLEQLALAHVPDPVIALLRSMLATEPGGRPSSAQELLTELQRCRQVIANPSFSFT